MRRRTLNQLEDLLGGLLVAADDIGGMEAHADERLAQTEELTTEHDDQISGVTALLRAPRVSEEMQLIRPCKHEEGAPAPAAPRP